jgi:hypothetical protein
MGAVELLGLAASISLLAGWRLYLCVFGVGLAMKLGWVDLPQQLGALDVLASWWVIGIAAAAALAEFFADKIPWVDSAWDGVHTVIRPLGGAVLALALVDARDPVWQVAIFLLGGGAAMLTHGLKATTRAAANLSPEPVSNIALSSGEDILSVGALALVLTHPAVAAAVAVLIIIAAVAMLVLIGRLLKRWKSALSGAP